MKNNNLSKASKEVMLLLDYRAYSINVSRVDASMEFTGKLTRLKDSKDVKLSRIWHCNGLILCCTKDIKRLVVWNPCTGETRSIKPSKFYRRTDSYAFGCGNSSCHDYKILRCSSYGSCVDFHHQVVLNFEMYEFSTDSWRVLYGVTDKWRLHCSDDVVSLKGNAYWIHFDRGAEHDWNVLLSFNFTTEVFVSLPLPDYQKQHCEYRDLLISVVREEHLAVLHHVVGTFLTEMNVWLSNKITEGKEVSWSKLLVFSFDKLSLPRRYSDEMTFWVDEENKVVVSCVRDMEGGDHFYIVGEGLHKQVYEVTEASWIWPCLLGYVPSLCHIPKAKEEENRIGNITI
ncbi:putative F-box/kelch-repeat protein [Raphanus sativus]|uniref:F-box/kelch-repeat protein At3g17540 n=1 Tax=Raphanus sativus TaxID=3726 RepID=A0A6J0M5R2_RAPSA|nr:putative F-box/kelch-repeat protein At3g17540 [Raphanus sativus]KAJ4912630.1 putative F-box/kelch-repeat protein [Raphanus sativus]